MEIVKGLKKKSLVYFAQDGHAFLANKIVNLMVYLVCRNNCGVTAVYNKANNLVKQHGQHNHNVDLLLRPKLELREFLRSKASSTNESFQKIFLDGQKRHPNAARSTGGLSYYRSMMFRARGRRFTTTPFNLTSLHEQLILEENQR